MCSADKLRSAALLLCGLLTTGCTGVAVSMAGDLAKKSAPHMRGLWDHELAMQANAAGIVQLESMHALAVDNEDVALMLASAYLGYAFGWVEVQCEQLEIEGNYPRADRQRARAALLYRRARDLALGVMRRRHAGIDAALAAGPEALSEYLADHYREPATDLQPVFLVAAGWSAMMGTTEDLSTSIDLPKVLAMARHVAELDASHEHGAPLVFLGGFYSQYPAQFGGDPAKGKAYFEQALKLTERRAHQVQLNYARLYAVTVGDRALFLSLLNEVLEPQDEGSDVRLENKIARVWAELLITKVDTLF